MFWDAPFDVKAAEEACQQQYGVTPRPLWASVQYAASCHSSTRDWHHASMLLMVAVPACSIEGNLLGCGCSHLQAMAVSSVQVEAVV